MQEKREAFEYLEQSKGRAFLSLLATTNVKPSVKISPKLQLLLDEEEKCLILLRQAKTKHLLMEQTSETHNLDETTTKLSAIYNEIENDYRDFEYVFLRRGKPCSLTQIQTTIRSQDRNIVLVEYFVSHDAIIMFVVTSHSKEVFVESIRFSLSKMKYIFDRNLETLFSGGANINDVLFELDYLIEPISKYLEEEDVVYFIPHSFLHYLPLHALRLDEVPIIKQHPIVYVSSSSLMGFLQNKGSGKLQNLVSFGVDFEKEAEEVARLFRGECYLGANVTKNKIVNTVVGKDIIHFSCHGKFKLEEPLNSGIKLHKDEFLTAKEIFDLRWNSELVVLSACETGMSMNKGGDDLIGLTRGFLYAGTPSIIVSLWQVNSKSARELMIEFYNSLKNGLDKATALQYAQIKIMERYNDPYHWAPFILVGDWK